MVLEISESRRELAPKFDVNDTGRCQAYGKEQSLPSGKSPGSQTETSADLPGSDPTSARKKEPRRHTAVRSIDRLAGFRVTRMRTRTRGTLLRGLRFDGIGG